VDQKKSIWKRGGWEDESIHFRLLLPTRERILADSPISTPFPPLSGSEAQRRSDAAHNVENVLLFARLPPLPPRRNLTLYYFLSCRKLNAASLDRR